MMSGCRSPRTSVALSAVFASVLALAACGGSSGGGPYSTSPGNTGGPPTGGSSMNIAEQNLSFSPKIDTVAVGSTVTWTNKDAVTHTATADASGGFDSGDMAGGATFSHTFSQAGTYSYHCKYHGSAGSGMYGVIVVK